MNQKLTRAAVALTLIASAGIARSQTAPPSNPSQFDITGVLQTATLDATCGAGTAQPTPPAYPTAPAAAWQVCGGTITVNNQVITVPKYTLLQMPAAALTWFDVFYLAPAPYGSGLATPATGLAVNDVPAPLVKYEVHVIGNRVVDATGDRYIAGLLFLSQRSLQSGSGFINSIDYTTGEFRVGGTSPTTGQRVKINDPLGKFGRAWTPDVRFTIDENNPTIRSETGFPMCLPRTDPAGASPDPLCPARNRPDVASGATFRQVNFPAVANVVSVGPDPRLMAPFAVGDYVTYSGALLNDTAGLPYVAAYQVIANVGLFTYPGDALVYVATDVMLLGVGGASNAGAVEATVRTRFEGFTTDPSRNIQLWGIDVDPCTGAQTTRDWGSIDVDPGPPTGAVLGRWRFRPPSKVLTMPAAGVFIPATREMRSQVMGAAPYPDGNGGVLPGSGYYQAPIFEFLFPENAGVGKPIVPNNFEGMPFLALGSGPIDGIATNPILTQLVPWPLGFAAPPTPPLCNPQPPVVSLSAPATVSPNTSVTVTAVASDPNNPPQTPLTYAWTLNGVAQTATGSTFTYTSPSSGSSTVSVKVTNTVPLSATASATITVANTLPTASFVVKLGALSFSNSSLNIAPGQKVTLDASSSPNATAYQWVYTGTTPSGTTFTSSYQTSNIGVSTSPTNTSPSFTNNPIASFTAPTNITSNTTLTFRLEVSNAAGFSAPVTLSITVTPSYTPITIAGAQYKDSTGTNQALYGTTSNPSISFSVPSSSGSVTLDASHSLPNVAFNGTSGTQYAWKQTSGSPTLSMGSPSGVTTSVTLPSLKTGTSTFQFQLAVTYTGPTGSKSTTTANVVMTVTAPPDTITIVTALSKLVNGKQRLTVDANSSMDPVSNPAGPNPTLTMQGFDSSGNALFGAQNMPWTVPPAVVAPVYDVTFVGSPTPAKIVVKSSFGGVAYACLDTSATAADPVCRGAFQITTK